jgi:hypothetical protein
MSDKASKTPKNSRFRFIDFLIILICLSGALYFLYLFRLDMFQTINSRNEKPVGKITIKHNTVQRRFRDHLIWDRLRNESPVYLGDTIRVAQLSDAALNINDNFINLSENTLIRIQRARDGEESFRIDLAAGNLSLVTGTGGGSIILNIMDRQVKAEPGTILNASAGDAGIMVQLSEGKALFIEDEQTRELNTAEMIALDTDGVEQIKPAVSIKYPLPDAYFLKNRPEPLNIGFAWNRYYLRPEQILRLEIAEDRSFNLIAQILENLDSTATAVLGAGQWHWRLSYEDTVLSMGRITVAEAAGPELFNPVMNQLFRYQSAPPSLRFQWSTVAEASSYILEICDTTDFNIPWVRRPTGVEFSIESDIEDGTWYWRVMPVFPAVFEGNTVFSSVSFFRVERGELSEEPAPPESESVDNPEKIAAEDTEKTTSEPPLPDIPQPVPVNLRLTAPVRGARIPGLTALRQQTVFRWESDQEVVKSRFIISRDSNPLLGRPAVEIPNPGRTIRLDRLNEGVWYWTVEVQSVNGLVSAAAPQFLTVLPSPLLSAPGNRLPESRYRFDIEELKKSSTIVFRWQAVPDANAYIFTLFHQTANGKRSIISSAPENRLSWTLDDFTLLDGQGTFIWQVEAVNMGNDGRIEQRGRPGENLFIMDIPRAGPVNIKEPGVLYGN